MYYVDKVPIFQKEPTNLEEAYDLGNQLYQEFMFAQQLNHPNIINYKYFIHKYKSIPQSKEKTWKFHTIIEMMTGSDMKEHLKQNRNRKTIYREAKKIGAQIISALCYLQRKGVIHRDLKPANIVFNQDGSLVKLIDMGLAMEMSKEPGPRNGSSKYMAPE